MIMFLNYMTFIYMTLYMYIAFIVTIEEDPKQSPGVHHNVLGHGNNKKINSKMIFIESNHKCEMLLMTYELVKQWMYVFK